MSGKRILVIGSGQWQLHLIRTAKAHGLYVINTNLYEDSLGFRFADLGLAVDIYDKEGHLALAREYGVEAVTTDQIDIAVPTAAYVAEQLGLPGIGSRMAELFTNKVRMREFCAAHGTLQPAYFVCHSFEEAARAASSLGYPVIIKPTDNRSSRGVFKVGSEAELRAALPETLANSREPRFLVEQYIGGVELTVEGFKAGGGHVVLGCSRKEQFGHNTVLDLRLLYLKDDGTIPYDRLKKSHNRLVDATGLPFGITHAEYKYWNGDFYFIEFAARGGGANISSHIVPLVSGVDVTGTLIRAALGEQITEVTPLPQDKAATLEFLSLPPGRVKSVRGVEEIRAMPNVVDFGLAFREGDEIALPADGGSRAGHFIAYAESDAALAEVCERVRKTLSVDYE
ncbi:MAG: ATP-grasp domain-containing protein [Acidobacteria bacterium]|nr:ATP-grasp domain-containing protein [Acidobacteriota bacterium]